MAKSKTLIAFSNPARLPAAKDGDEEKIRVVIETPKGSRNKYAFDTEERVFGLTKVLPAGIMSGRRPVR